jgi:hypothetical protein
MLLRISTDEILILSALIGLIALGVMIWFLLNLQSAMNAVSKNNRSLDGGLVWLNLIPIFNFIWPFIFNSNLRSSYKKEFRTLRIDEEVRLGAGIIYPILQLITFGLPIFLSALFVGRGAFDDLRSVEDMLILINAIYILFGLGTFISMMVFWSQANTHKYLLKQHQEGISMSNLNNGQYYRDQNYGSFVPPVPPVPPAPPSHYNTIQHTPPVQAPVPPPVPPQNRHFNDNSFENRGSLNQNSEEKSNTTTNQIKKEETPVEKLKKYHDLLNSGLITQADFDAIKKELLNIK